MTFDEQHTGPALEREPEPRLLLRSDRTSPQSTRPRAKQRPARKPNRRLRLWGKVALALLMLLAVLVCGAAVYLRHALEASLPPIDGRVHVAGLSAPILVARDARGVPIITTTGLPDLLFAQGYVTAEDRLWQMDLLRRHAAGELAEILGPALAEHDRRQRVLRVRAAADRAVAGLPPDQRLQLEAYARGVNAFVALASAHGHALPVEFHLLAYKPAPWTPRDSLLVSLAMWQDLSTGFPRKLDREALRAHLPPELFQDLYPVGSWRDQPPAAQGRDLTAPHEVEQIPLDPSQSRSTPPPPGLAAAPAGLLALDRALGSDPCEGCRAGSNNWAVSGAHTASGAPLVANDMHLNLSIPDIWYEASLHTAAGSGDGSAPALDVTGFTLPGVPFVIVGRNRDVAWGLTNLGADVQDVRVEHLRGEGAETEYTRDDGSWAPVMHHRESIRVRGGRDLILDVLTTAHRNGTGTMETPIISPLYPGEQRPLSLAWTAYDPAAVTSPFLRVNTATDGPSLEAALANFGGPALNLVWADRSGSIGYHALGFIPVRGSLTPQPRTPAAPPATGEPGPLPQDEGAAAGAMPLPSAQTRWVPAAYRPGARGAMRRRNPARAPAPTPVTPQQAPGPAPATAVTYTIGSPVSAVPVDSLDAAQAWSGYVPYSALPAVTDPKNGFLATANARITPDDYPYALAIDWADPFRVERIVHMLDGRRGLTADDMLRMETDVHSDVNLALAQRLAYALDHADAKVTSSDAGRLREAANLLRDWDGSVAVTSPAAAIVSVARKALWPALLTPKIAAHDGLGEPEAASFAALYTWGEQTSALELLLQHEPRRWLPSPWANWNDFLAATTAQALRQAHAPAHLAGWQYGDVHTVEIAHPLLGGHPWLDRLLGIRGTSGVQPAPGDSSTIDAIGAHFGPSERFVADLASPEGGLGNITTGQSANPRSPWYLDQFRPWLAGTSFPLPGAQTPAAHTLTLLP